MPLFSTLTGCGDKSKTDLKEANDKMKEANKDLVDATKEASKESAAKLETEWKTFKQDSDTTVAGMEKNIDKLKEKISKKSAPQQARMQNDIKKLDVQKQKLTQEDKKIETGLKNFDHAVAESNQAFQKEFKHDMQELGTAIKDLFTDNVK